MYRGWSATLRRLLVAGCWLLVANLILPDKLFLKDPLSFESEDLFS